MERRKKQNKNCGVRCMKNRIIGTVCSVVALCVCFLLCRYSFLGLHGMKQYPVFLLAVGLIALIVAAIFDGRKIMIFTIIGYMGGFVLGMLFNTDGVDQSGARTNNAWWIWTVSFAVIILAGVIWEIVSKRRKRNNTY